MRMGLIIAGVLLGGVLLWVLITRHEVRRTPAPQADAGATTKAIQEPGLRGASPASPGQEVDVRGPAPTPSQVRRWIVASLKLPAGAPGWPQLKRWLTDERIDFAPYLEHILKACMGDTAAAREPGVRLLAVALDPGPLSSFTLRAKGVLEAHPLYSGPLRPAHFDSALGVAPSGRAPEAAHEIFRRMSALGPRAEELIPHAMDWLAGERRRFDARAARLVAAGIEDHEEFESSGLKIARAIAELGVPALRYLDPWLADGDDGGRDLAESVVLLIGLDAGPSLVQWMRSGDPRVREGALAIFDTSRLDWSSGIRAAAVACMRDPHERVREHAIGALVGWLYKPDVAHEFAHVLRGTDPALRVATLEALASHQFELGDDLPASIREAVLDIMAEPRETEDEAILQLWKRMEWLPNARDMGHAAGGLLRALVRSGALPTARDNRDLTDYESLWSELGPEAWPHLWKGLQSEDAAMGEAAGWAMAWAGDPDSVHRRLLRAWLVDHEESPVHTHIAAALAAEGQIASVPVLLEGLRADTWGERAFAAVGLRRLGGDALPHLRALAAAIGDANARRIVEAYAGLPRRPDLPDGENHAATNTMESAFEIIAARDLEVAYELIAHESWDVRFLIGRVLSRAEARGMAVLQKLWPRASLAERTATLDVLRRMDDWAPMKSEVLASFRSSDRALRVAAAVLLFWDATGPLGVETADALADAAVRQTSHAPDMVGHAASRALLGASTWEKPHARALTALRKYEKHADRVIRERAKKLIKEIEADLPPAGALPPLR